MNNNTGKIIAISSVKGGVGKTITTLNLAGLYFLEGKKVLVVDLDLYSGGIATCLNIETRNDIYTLVENMNSNQFTAISEYVCKYNNGIDVLACPKNPQYVSKIESKYIVKMLTLARQEYDIVLVDMNHIMDEINLVTLDTCQRIAFIISNDIVDLKNMRSLISILEDTGMENYKVILNNSRDTGKDYISLFDIRNIIQRNVDYTISSNFYIRNIDKYILKGEILTLNKSINMFYGKDIKNMKKLALALIDDDGVDK